MDFGNYLPSQIYRRDFVEQARRLFDEQIEHYCDERELLASQSGWKKTPRKRRLEPYLWLAGFHVLRWSEHLIADAEDKDSPRTVGEQIMQVASEIGLSVRDVRDYDGKQTIDIVRKRLAAARKFLEDLLPDDISTDVIGVAPPLIKRLLS